MTLFDTPASPSTTMQHHNKHDHKPMLPLNVPCRKRKMQSCQNVFDNPNPYIDSASPSGPNSSTGRLPMAMVSGTRKYL